MLVASLYQDDAADGGELGLPVKTTDLDAGTDQSQHVVRRRLPTTAEQRTGNTETQDKEDSPPPFGRQVRYEMSHPQLASIHLILYVHGYTIILHQHQFWQITRAQN